MRADLKSANLAEVSLMGAKLKFADLEDANLEGADLKGVDLRFANLKGANLEGADLEGTNLQAATYNDDTTWPDGSEGVKTSAIYKPSEDEAEASDGGS